MLVFVATLALWTLNSENSAQAKPDESLDVQSCVQGKAEMRDNTACKLCMGVEDLGCDSATPGPNVDGIPTWEVRYADTRGPNFREQNVVLLAMKDGGPRLLWAHKSIDASALPKHLQPLQESIVFHWNYSRDGKSIFATGVKTIGVVDDLRAGAAHGKRIELESERYFYDRQWGQFLPG